MNKFLKDVTFTKVFFIWFALFFLLLMINMQTVQNSLLVSITGAALGVFLLIFPVPRPTPSSAATARSVLSMSPVSWLWPLL